MLLVTWGRSRKDPLVFNLNREPYVPYFSDRNFVPFIRVSQCQQTNVGRLAPKSISTQSVSPQSEVV